MQFYKKYNNRAWFILASIILFWPLGVYLMYRHHKLSMKARGIVVSSLLATTTLFGVAAFNAPPSLALSTEGITSNQKTDNDFILLEGSVSSARSTELYINGKQVQLTSAGKFSHKLSLEEGDTGVKIVAKSDKGSDTETFSVHRTTAVEFTERKRIAEAQEAEAKRVAVEKAEKAKADAINAMPTCDGTTTKANCKHEGAIYKTYNYYPAIAEKSHKVIDTTYKEVVTGYCTLCSDGTYSPSCATGRGACSWHGGVAQWNAPRTSREPVNTERVVVDAPAVAERYEKVLDPAFN
jgi:hypothetical protein